MLAQYKSKTRRWLPILIGIMFLYKNEYSYGVSLVKGNICDIFPISGIIRNADNGTGYKQNKEEVYGVYKKIAHSLVLTYRSEIKRLASEHWTLKEIYDFSGRPFIGIGVDLDYFSCSYKENVEYDARELGINTTAEWVNDLSEYSIRNNNKQRYMGGDIAFSVYDVFMKFSKSDGDLFEIDIQKYNVNFNKFPYLAMRLTFPLNKRPKGLILRKTEFPQ
jgi:hypothetical protein